MTTLNRTTCRRLQKLPQLRSVWEGDRRVLPNGMSTRDSDAVGECILWVDGSEGVVRAMDVVAPEVGHEAVVRTLLRAMEHPHSFTKPARPCKIVVRDRELQFLLRGILQDLDIVVDYEPALPVIDELLRGFEEFSSNRPPHLPPYLDRLLNQAAATIWKDAPWDYLQEQQIVAITVSTAALSDSPAETLREQPAKAPVTEPETLYVSIMGMLGMEYGLLLYRSIESLKQFRQQAMQPHSLEVMEEAFLQQDCLFLTYEAEEAGVLDEDVNLVATLPPDAIEANFGNIHPLEGIRPVLYTEEATTVFLALEGLHRFLQKHARKLKDNKFPALSSCFQIPLPVATELQLASRQTPSLLPPMATVHVETLPDLADELLGPEKESDRPILRNNLLPEKCLVSIGMLPWHHVRVVRQRAAHYQKPDRTFPEKGQGLPIVLVQTSRPKAKQLMQQIAEAEGLEAICFTPGEDPFGEKQFDLGILKLANQQLQLFGEYLAHDPIHRNARKKWDQRCRSTQGYCGLVIAMGISVARENPQAEHMLGLYEVPFLTPAELGLGPLQLQPPLLPDWAWEDWKGE
ncbi:DUF6930 domain-containing protein [Trichothermofontia sp.]